MSAKQKSEPAATPDALADFENSLAELETLVQALETGEIGLEQALVKFERGVALARKCQEALKAAELRVEQLLESDGDIRVTEFDPPGNGEA